METKKKQLNGIYQEPPTAMMDAKGNLVTSKKALEQLSLNMYTERLKSHDMKESLKLHQVQQENMLDQRLQEAQDNVTPD